MALITDLGVDGNGIFHPKLKHKWRVNFQGIAGDPQPLRVQAVTADRPKVRFDEVVLDRYNSKAYVAGKHEYEPVNISFEADIGGQVEQTVQQQLEIQQKLIGNGAAPRLPSAIAGSVYKFAVKLESLDGDDLVLESWLLEGAWFSNVDWGDLDYSTSDALRITATIRFDNARQLITGVTKNATGGAGSQ
jgi:hypothetical protein